MRCLPAPQSDRTGATLLTVVVIGGIMGITLASLLMVSSTALRSAHGRADWDRAFFHAENALQWACQLVADTNPVTANATYTTVDGSLNIDYMAAARTNPSSGLRNAWVKINRTNSALPNDYLVIASAKVGDKVRTVQASITRNPPSKTFDYEYFLNNWGWWWGSTIYGNGGNRANWDFDFRDNPTVNGEILANGHIAQNGTPVDNFTNSPPFVGLAGADPVALAHAGVPREPMPNLQNLTNYENQALANTSTNGLWVGTNQVVFGVHTNGSKPGLYIEGTASAPILISNTVVVRGDVVIKGVITGRGALYVGGNLYVAGDLNYKNGPNYTTPPETMAATNRDAWVSSNLNKDLVAFAVRGSVLGGDVNSGDWKGWCYDPAAWGLSTVGDETHLGADGIMGTPDDNIPFLHADGTISTAYDADGDGTYRGNYNYNNDLTMTTSRANQISGYPTNTSGVVSYDTVASNNLSLLEAIFYTNHAFAMRMATSHSEYHGSVISRNEAIIFNSTCTFTYDSRIHSRYNSDPNRLVNLGLPRIGVRVTSFAELAPDTSDL